MPISATFVVLFVSVAAATGAFLWLLTEPQATRRRLSQVAQGGEQTGNEIGSVLGDAPSMAVKRARSFIPKSPRSMNQVQRMMTAAGYEGPWPAVIFVFVQLAMSAAVFIFGVTYF